MDISEIENTEIKNLLTTSEAFKLMTETDKQNFLTKIKGASEIELAPIIDILKNEKTQNELLNNEPEREKIVTQIEEMEKTLDLLKRNFKKGRYKITETFEEKNEESTEDQLLNSLSKL